MQNGGQDLVSCRIGVLVPSYRRHRDLRRCLAGLRNQSRRADEVVVVRRHDDVATRDVVAEFADLGVREIVAWQPGLMHALTCGIVEMRSDFVAMTDDDAVPRPDWLALIEATFRQDSRVAGVGGRDAIAAEDVLQSGGRPVVGRLQWFGRFIGNHHLGIGPARDVDALKGVNHCYRLDLLHQTWLRLRLRGQGTQVHSELSIGLNLVRSGWRLIYDPAILVDHFPAVRHGEHARDAFCGAALSDEVHNETLALMHHLTPLRRVVFLAWALTCGTRAYPGILCWLLEGARRRPHMSSRLLATQHGRWLGVRSWTQDWPVASARPVARALDMRV